MADTPGTHRMQDWQLLVIFYNRGTHIELDAINAGVVGVGKTILEARDDFQQALVALAEASVRDNLRLTFEPDAEDLALFESITKETLGQDTLRDKGIVGSMRVSLRRIQTEMPVPFSAQKHANAPLRWVWNDNTTSLVGAGA